MSVRRQPMHGAVRTGLADQFAGLIVALCLPLANAFAADPAAPGNPAATNAVVKATVPATVAPAAKTAAVSVSSTNAPSKIATNRIVATIQAPTNAVPTDSAAKSKLAAAVAAAKAAAKTAPKSAAKGPSGNAVSRIDYTAFRVVVDNNIFNPNRRYRGTNVIEAPPAVRVDAFALVGVMSYEKGQFAFFDGTSSQYKKAAKAGDQIGDYTVTEIGSKQVKLKVKDTEMDFPLGKQMRRVDGGEWKMTDSTSSFTSSGGYSSSSGLSGSSSRETTRREDRISSRFPGFTGRTGATDSATATNPPDAAAAPPSDTTINDGDDLITRLRKKREAEMNKQ